MIELLKRVILENQEMISRRNLFARNYSIPQTDNITVLTGIRRCGKTFTLYELSKKYKPEEILFIDFEDERLLALNALDNYDVIIDSYKVLYPEITPVIFFDEIQNLNNWHLYLKRIHVRGYKLFVTGSNAHMISSEIATYLKGRSIETKIYPFSFPEFLQIKNIKVEANDLIVNQPKFINLFDEYMQYGGFPEVIIANQNDKRAVAKNIYQLLFYKDLVAKYGKDDYLLKLVVNKVAENVTKDFSVTSLAKKIISVHKTSVPTVTDYFNILPEPFLAFNIFPYRNSFVQRESKRKTYLADNSFIWLNRIAPDHSRLFENLVFHFLQRRFDDIFYYRTRNDKEVDFFIVEGGVKIMAQASYSLEDEETLEREIASLYSAMEEQNLEVAYIYTYNHAEELEYNNKTIRIVPLWKEYLSY
ncbi:MAG: ATP-binding protein [Prolixibacteraceae bacterium]|nr:ATP-binding protein [Prolixibacteraceae bacterium]